MKKYILTFICLIISIVGISQTTLTHNLGNDLVKTKIYACSWGGIKWARVFKLEEFNISDNEEFIIKSASIGLFNTGSWDVRIQFNIYEVDENFPNSFSTNTLIGSSQIERAPYLPSTSLPEIMKIDFNNPVVVPAESKRILIEAHQLSSSASSAIALAAGTIIDKDISWFKSENGGCPPDRYTSTTDLNLANGVTNFYIVANGEAKTIFPFSIINDNSCSNFSNNLSLTNQSEIKSVVWDFDDPSSGVNNTSNAIDANHQFTSSGIYNVTATVTHTDNKVYTIPKEIEIFDVPNVNKEVSLKQCDNSDIDGFSLFNLNEIKEQIISNSDNYTITFYEEKILAENKGTTITNITQYENQQVSTDTIWARTENANGCFSVSEVDLLVSTTQIPIKYSKSFYQCDDGSDTSDGVATFDFSEVTSEILDIFPSNQQLDINYFKNEADALAEENKIDNISSYQNTKSPNQQIIYIRVDSKIDNSCLGLGAHIILNVEKVPIANPVFINPECDFDRDGLFSFDTSSIQSTIVGNQTNVEVSYVDENGNILSTPLPNPFITNSQKITARIENSNSRDKDGKCYDNTVIDFVVNTVPMVNNVNPIELCDDDFDGMVAFDTSNIETSILGNQTDIIVSYFDENDNKLPSPIPNPFFTHSQDIRVRLENNLSSSCFTETQVSFIVHKKPLVEVIEEDIICVVNGEKNLTLSVIKPNENLTYEWLNNNNEVIGKASSIEINSKGIYKVKSISKFGCESEIKEVLVKESSLSTVDVNNIEVKDDSDNNYIRVNTESLGLGEYEFRLLDSERNIIRGYQEDSYFEDLDGNTYILEINDKNNCGSIEIEISLINFPKFFTPNNDGKNDYWHIEGKDKSYYKEIIIHIFNRFGKKITSININDIGWNGTLNGRNLPEDDYWFMAYLTNYKDEVLKKTGYFSLIRK